MEFYILIQLRMNYIVCFLVLCSSIILRNLEVDKHVNRYLEKNKSKKNVENFYAKTKEEKLAFLKNYEQGRTIL